MDATARLANYIKTHPDRIGKVVNFEAGIHRLLHFDLTADNAELSADIVNDTALFTQWVNEQLKSGGYQYGVGGYMEHRTIYQRSALFDTEAEPRRLHLGIDIWGDAETPVYAPLDGVVHSFKNNDNFGDYGPTIILQHNLDGLTLYSLYGHLNAASLDGLSVGKSITKDQQIACFGEADENGNWPPHLHFQLLFDMEGMMGDYPGVARYSEKAKWLKNIPDPNLILRFPVS